MNEPTLEELNNARKQGFRPGVVVCVVNDNKLAMFHKDEFSEWQIPQGGIENGESTHEAIYREMVEELGEKFVNTFKDPIAYIGSDQLEFPKARYGVKDLKTDDGKEVLMKGKKYYIYAISTDEKTVDINETEFDSYFWVGAEQAAYLANASKAKNKKKLVLRIIEQLTSSGFIK